MFDRGVSVDRSPEQEGEDGESSETRGDQNEATLMRRWVNRKKFADMKSNGNSAHGIAADCDCSLLSVQDDLQKDCGEKTQHRETGHHDDADQNRSTTLGSQSEQRADVPGQSETSGADGELCVPDAAPTPVPEKQSDDKTEQQNASGMADCVDQRRITPIRAIKHTVPASYPTYFSMWGGKKALKRFRGLSRIGGMAKLSIKDLDLAGRTVFIRVDFNVPLSPDGQEITSDKRIRASLPTIQYALEHSAGVVLASHLGRPKGKFRPEMSLAPVAKRLSQLLGKQVVMAPAAVGNEVSALKPEPGQILLLENLRFHPEEEANDSDFSRQLASVADVYVNDAFGSAHRAHASTVGVVAALPIAAAGLLMEKEIEWLTRVTQNPERPCVGLLGGAKVSDKIEVIQNLIKIVDHLLIGGAMAYTFLRAEGKPTGKSLVEEDKVELAKQLMREHGAKLVFPVDHVVVREIKPGAAHEVVTTIAPDQIAVDIGPRTVEEFSKLIESAKTIVWNGPMGIFEMPPFDTGTVALAKAVAESGAVSVVGGGDSEKAIKSAGVADQITHVSTGGGASLEFLSGLELPGVVALTDKG